MRMRMSNDYDYYDNDNDNSDDKKMVSHASSMMSTASAPEAARG